MRKQSAPFELIMEEVEAVEEEEEAAAEGGRFVTYPPSTDLSGLDPKALYRVVSPERSIFPALKTSTPCTSWPFPDCAVFALLRPFRIHDPRISAMVSASLPWLARMCGIP